MYTPVNFNEYHTGGWLWILLVGLCTLFALMLPWSLSHHAVICRHEGDVNVWHNHLRDVVADFCRQAHLRVSVERGHSYQGS